MATVTQEEIDQRTEDLTNYYYQLGESSGLSMAANVLLDEATRCFRFGRDADAKLLRNWSEDLRKQSEEKTPSEDTRP